MKDNGVPRQLLLIIDGILVWTAFWVVAILRPLFRSLVGQAPNASPLLDNLDLIIAVAIPIIPLTLEGLGYYQAQSRFRENFKKLLSGVFICSVILLVIMIVTRALSDSRFLLLGFPVILSTLLAIRGAIVHHYQKKKKENDALKQSVQIFGSGKEVDEFKNGISAARYWMWDLQEEVNLESVSTEELVQLLKERSVATAVFLAGKTEFSKVSSAIELCESMGIESMVVSDFLRTKLSIPSVETVAGRTMITLSSTPSISYSILAKKALDRLGAFTLIVCTSPLWLIAAIGIRIKSPSGPVFFRQKRAGICGRPFTMWKFRTMHIDAEAQLAKVKQDVGNEMDGPVFKLDNDPRVFGWGSFLRKTSIDELPQLINVLTGEMSLVGPRPLPVYEVEEFQKSEHRRRLSVKPGITCLWQAGGRNSITNFDDWVALDLKYIDNWSFWLDLKILLMTVPAVLFSRGAK